MLALGFLIIPILVLPVSQDYYTVPKWMAVHILSCSLLFQFFFRKELRIPQIPKPLFCSFALLGITYVMSMVHSPGAYEGQILDWLCFFVIVIAAFNGFSGRLADRVFDRINQYNFWATVIVLSYGTIQIFSGKSLPGSTFGFQNMAAEYLGLSALLQFDYLFRSTSGKKLKYLRVSLFLYTLISLYFLASRTTDLALAASLVWLGYQRFRSPKRRFYFLATMLVTLGTFIILAWQLPSKQSTLQIRLNRWANTLVMIKDHPWLGVGPGNYEFGYIPYHRKIYRDLELSEDLLVRSPHNGYLEAATECGILFLSCFLAVIFLLSRNLFRKMNSPYRGLAVSVFLFLLIDAFFNFPMELAYPFYCAAVFLGLVLAELYKFQTVKNQLCVFIFVPLMFTIIPLSVFSFSSEILLYLSENSVVQASSSYDRALERSCRLFPSNWRACVRSAELNLQSTDFDKAKTLLDRMLAQMPFNYPALYYRALLNLSIGDKKAACFDLMKYDDLFFHESRLTQVRKKKCYDWFWERSTHATGL